MSPAEGPVGAVPPSPAVAAADVNAALNLRASSIVELDVNPALVGLQLNVDVPIDGVVYRLDLRPYSVRAPGFRLIEHLADGTERDVDPGPVNTLRGEVVGMPGSAIAGGMMPEGLYLTMIFPDGQQFWLEPIVGRVAGAAKNHYAIYRSGDALGGGFCGTTDDQRRPDAKGGGDPGDPGERGLTLWTAQMATDADYEFYARWGGTVQANGRINLVTNVVNLQYERDLDIHHVISISRLRTAEPDPYSTTDPAALNAELVAAWSGESFDNIDVIQHFTGKEMDGGIIGRANAIGSICDNQNSSCWVQSDFNNNFSSASDLSAHELGHLWNGVHCTCSDPPSTMNPFITSVNRFGVNANDLAVTDIPAYRNTRACLTTAGSTTSPPNDNCNNAVRIVPGTYGYNNFNATSDGPAPTNCGSGNLIGADIWYYYVPTCGGTVTVDTCFENSLDSVLVAYSGFCGGANLTQVACNDDSSPCPGGVGTRQSRISFPVNAGETYYIRLGGYNGFTGFGYMTIAQATCPAPVNDNCGSATLVAANTDVPFSTIGATTDGPLEVSCLGLNDNTVGSDIWYRWVSTCTQNVTVSLCGSSFDTKVAIYGACPEGVNQAIACDDDFCGLGNSLVTFAAVSGTTYRIRVGGYANQVGVGTLRIIGCVLPTNDACANAIDVSAGGTFSGSVSGATNDGTASCGASADQPDVWYRFTAACGGVLRVTTCGTHDAPGLNLGMDTVLALFSSCGGIQLDCNDDTTTCGMLDQGMVRDSAVSANLAPGESVLIRASRYSTVTAGPFTLNVSFPDNDHCVNALAVGLGTTPFCTIGATTDGPSDATLCEQNNDVWYRFTATCDAPVRVSICGADYDSEIGVYADTCPAAAPAIACNDDSCGLQSAVTVPASSGTTYLIRVGGWCGDCRGSGDLVIRLAGDWNADGSVNSGDISSYLTAWLASVSELTRDADFNNDNVVNSNDISTFLTAWLAAINC